MTPRNLAILSLVLATIIWGAAAPIFKWALFNIPPFTLGFLRFSFAAFLLLPFCFRLLKVQGKDWGEIILAGILGVFLNVAFFFLGIQRTLAINASVITMFVPILTLFAAAIFLKENLTKKLVWAAVLSTLGVVFILLEPIIKGGLDIQLLGDFLLILAGLSWVGYEVLSKKLFRHYSPLAITFYSFLIGGFAFLPFAIREYYVDPSWILQIDVRGVTGIFYGIFFSSLLGYFAWQWGLSKIPASEAGFFIHLNPVANILVAVPLLGEKVTPPFLFGALLVGLGVYLAEHKRLTHPLHKIDKNP